MLDCIFTVSPVCLFITTAMAYHGSFQSCPEENSPNPKSGWDLDPVKLVCATSCREYETDQASLHLFVVLVPDFPTFATESRVGYRVSSSRTPHKVYYLRQ